MPEMLLMILEGIAYLLLFCIVMSVALSYTMWPIILALLITDRFPMRWLAENYATWRQPFTVSALLGAIFYYWLFTDDGLFSPSEALVALVAIPGTNFLLTFLIGLLTLDADKQNPEAKEKVAEASKRPLSGMSDQVQRSRQPQKSRPQTFAKPSATKRMAPPQKDWETPPCSSFIDQRVWHLLKRLDAQFASQPAGKLSPDLARKAHPIITCAFYPNERIEKTRTRLLKMVHPNSGDSRFSEAERHKLFQLIHPAIDLAMKSKRERKAP